MPLREFFVLLMVCTLWGLHFVVMRAAIGDAGLPPVFYAATRMSVVALLMLPFLRWHSGQMGRVLLAALGFGGLNYLFIFPALGMTTASAASVAIELYMPFSVILSVLILGERIKAWSTVGIVLAFAGVVVIGLSGQGGDAGPLFALGLAMIALAALMEAGAAIAIKTFKEISPLGLLAWSGVIGSLVLWPASFVFESGQAQAFAPDTRWTYAGAVFYSAVLASIAGHGSYYWLLGRLPISVISPVGLLTTVIGVIGGLVILREAPTLGLFAGMALTLTGVAIILWRSRAKAAKVS